MTPVMRHSAAQLVGANEGGHLLPAERAQAPVSADAIVAGTASVEGRGDNVDASEITETVQPVRLHL